MNTRPTSVTVISWIILVTSALGLVATFVMINNPTTQELMAKTPLPLPVQYAMTFVGLSIGIVSGIFMLKGANWARMLYIGWGVLGLAIGLVTSPMKLMMLPGALFFAIIVFFLLRPRANAFFSGTTPVT